MQVLCLKADDSLIQQKHSDDFVIVTGVQYILRQFIDWTLEALSMQLRLEGECVNEVAYAVITTQARQSMALCSMDRPIVCIDPRYFRLKEVETLWGIHPRLKHYWVGARITAIKCAKK